MGDGLSPRRAEDALLLQVEHPLQPKALNAVLVVFEGGCIAEVRGLSEEVAILGSSPPWQNLKLQT